MLSSIFKIIGFYHLRGVTIVTHAVSFYIFKLCYTVYVKIQNPLTLVIFGATGNLYNDKLAKALYLLFLWGKMPLDFNIIAFGRRDFTDQAFRALTQESILSRGEIYTSKLDDFLKHISYFKGDFSEKNDFVKLKDLIQEDEDVVVLLHVATASQMYEKIFENILHSELNKINKDTKILIEKPFGKNEADAEHLQKVLLGIFDEKNIFHVDHYLAKETASGILDYKFNKNLVEKVKIIFHESNIVGSRGMYYDAVGAFRDVGQNHMLQLLALTIMDKPESFDAESIRTARLNTLHDLFIDPKQKIARAQYADYQKELGAGLHSETETFFRLFLRSKNPDFANAIFELEGGKGLADMHSDITSTTVAVQIYFKNGDVEETKIQPVPGTVYESYTGVYNGALLGDQTNFPSVEEIEAEWRLTDELLSKWKNIPLLIYKKGERAENII